MPNYTNEELAAEVINMHYNELLDFFQKHEIKVPKPEPKYHDVRVTGCFYASSRKEAVLEFIKWIKEEPYEVLYEVLGNYEWEDFDAATELRKGIDY